MVDLPQIEAALDRIRDKIYITPCVESKTFSRLTGNSIFFKLENLQMTGSFKERGALNKLLILTRQERERGVITASAGNHAQAVSYHATILGIRSIIYMPINTPQVKVLATQAYGAEVILHGENYDEANSEARRRAAADGLTLVHAFDDDAVIAGQGTLGLELLQQNPSLEAVVAPIGGGGLIGGIGCAMKAKNSKIRVIGVQTARVPSMKAAIAAGHAVTVPAAKTIADGIAVRRTGEHTFPLAQKYVDEVVTVEEEEIANAILLLLEREKTLAEGAGAAAIAALLNKKVAIKDAQTAVLVCGGNIDVTLLARIIERGLVKDGRLVRLRIALPDRPGSLHELTSLVAAQRANIVELMHDRAYYGVHLGDTVIDITMETRGPEHVAELIRVLIEAGYTPDRVL